MDTPIRPAHVPEHFYWDEDFQAWAHKTDIENGNVRYHLLPAVLPPPPPAPPTGMWDVIA